MRNFLNILVLALLLTGTAQASFRAFTTATAGLGHFTDFQCGTDLTCAQSSGKMLLTLTNMPRGIFQVQASTSGDLSTADCGKTIISALALDPYVLPGISDDTALGCRITFIVGATGAASEGMTITPKTVNEQILLLTDATGEDISADAIGESIVLEAISAGLTPTWAPVGAEKGSWVDTVE